MSTEKRFEHLSAQIDPHNIDAEELLIGEVFAGGSPLSLVKGILTPEMFFSGFLGAIYGAALDLSDYNSPINIISLTRSLESTGFKDIGSNSTISGFVHQVYGDIVGRTYCPNGESFVYAAEVVREMWVRRKIISIARETISLAQDMSKPIAESISRIQDDLSAIARFRDTKQTVFSVGEAYSSRVMELLDADGVESSPAIPTGFPSIDAMLDGGFRCGDLHVIAGASGMGKSMFAFQIAMNIAIATKKPVFIASMEMSTNRVVDRWIAATAQVPLSNIRRRNLNSDEGNRILESISMGNCLNNVAIDEDSSAPLTQIVARAKEFARNHAKKYGGDGQLGLLVIDNLQIAEMGDEGDKNTVNAINKFCKDCKGFAKELNIPVVILSQMNRASLSGNDKRPTAQGLFGATGIQANADAVLGIYRDEYYNKDTVDRGVAEILPLKVRDSAPDTVAKLEFQGHYASFVDRASVKPKLVKPKLVEMLYPTLVAPASTSDEANYFGDLEVGCQVMLNISYSTPEEKQEMNDRLNAGEIPKPNEACGVMRLSIHEHPQAGKFGIAHLILPDNSEMKVAVDELRRI